MKSPRRLTQAENTRLLDPELDILTRNSPSAPASGFRRSRAQDPVKARKYLLAFPSRPRRQRSPSCAKSRQATRSGQPRRTHTRRTLRSSSQRYRRFALMIPPFSTPSILAPPAASRSRLSLRRSRTDYRSVITAEQIRHGPLRLIDRTRPNHQRTKSPSCLQRATTRDTSSGARRARNRPPHSPARRRHPPGCAEERVRPRAPPTARSARTDSHIPTREAHPLRPFANLSARLSRTSACRGNEFSWQLPSSDLSPN